jgi:hypothetical protein
MNKVPSLEDFLVGRVVSIVASVTVTLDPRMWTVWWHHPEYLRQKALRASRPCSRSGGNALERGVG